MSNTRDERKTAAGGVKRPENAPKSKNPGLEVVNVYGSGPLPIGERLPENDEKRRQDSPGPENPGALSTSLEGKREPG